MADRREPTGWVGWAIFACVLIILVGGFNIIYGLVGVFDDQRLVTTRNGLLVFDTTTWGWILLIIGVVQVFAALAIFSGRVWGRIVGILMAGLNAWAQLTILEAQPVWSSLIIAVDVLVIYALAVHGREMASIE
ncbi:MAG TPA: hypothetical protein VID47_11620 [Actinomycetota bacterium]|jgi:hypothetical protein